MFQVPPPRLPYMDTHSRPSLPTPSLMHMPTCFGPCTNRAFAMLQVCALARFCLLCRSLSARHLFHLLCLYSLRSRSRSALAVFLQRRQLLCRSSFFPPPLLLSSTGAAAWQHQDDVMLRHQDHVRLTPTNTRKHSHYDARSQRTSQRT